MHIIDQIIATPSDQKTQILRSTILVGVTMHEAGHILIADHLGKTKSINHVNLPRFDSYFSLKLIPNEGAEDATAGIGIESREFATLSSRNQAGFYLGGILGEFNVYSHDEQNDQNYAMQVMAPGAIADFKKAIDLLKASKHPGDVATVKILQSALSKSLDGAISKRFIDVVRSSVLPGHRLFQDRADDHRRIAKDLFDKWASRNFKQFKATSYVIPPATQVANPSAGGSIS